MRGSRLRTSDEALGLVALHDRDALLVLVPAVARAWRRAGAELPAPKDASELLWGAVMLWFFKAKALPIDVLPSEILLQNSRVGRNSG